jgi:hypothetical protein
MARDRDTYVHRLGVTPETASVISSKNKIYAIPADSNATTAFQIGVVATFDPSETRAVEPVRGVGFGDQIAELVPGVTEPMTLAVTRTAQYLSMVYQVFGYKGGVDGLVRSLRHHKWPFDIVQEMVISQMIINGASTANDISETSQNLGYLNPDQIQAILTYFEGCWISDYSSTYAADTALVQENVTVNVTEIVANNGNESADYYTETSTQLFNQGAVSKIITSETVNP